jgi:ribonuclease D
LRKGLITGQEELKRVYTEGNTDVWLVHPLEKDLRIYAYYDIILLRHLLNKLEGSLKNLKYIEYESKSYVELYHKERRDRSVKWQDSSRKRS